MKKRWGVGITLVIFCLFFMNSCDAHFGNVHYDVPWWVIAVPVCLVSLITWFAAAKYIRSHKYICPKCSKSFYPNFWAAGVSLHIEEKRYFKCPHCKERSFCKKED